MEKFSLKWNDFQSIVSKSFSILRYEEDFYDVTLVSDDEQHISAHKLVLSASSVFFKNILKKTSHKNPMIYLNGFSSKDLYLVMDYIYQGEVKIFQDDLNNFLDVALKLKIEGLMGGGDNRSTVKKEDYEEVLHESEEEILENPLIQQPKLPKQHRLRNTENATTLVSESSMIEDAKAAVDEIVEKVEDGWRCKTCGKTTTRASDIRRHAEIHIEGLAFDCPLCGKTFRARKHVNNHKQKEHKNIFN